MFEYLFGALLVGVLLWIALPILWYILKGKN